jgi:hypothetical protein
MNSPKVALTVSGPGDFDLVSIAVPVAELSPIQLSAIIGQLKTLGATPDQIKTARTWLFADESSLPQLS